MRSKLSVIVIAAMVLVAGFVFAQGRAGRSSFHMVTLPTTAEVGEDVDKLLLLETAHLTLSTILVPKRTLHTPTPAPGQVTLQALSGSGEVRIGQNWERVDTRHMVVFAPEASYEIRATGNADLVLLSHELPPPGKRTARSR